MMVPFHVLPDITGPTPVIDVDRVQDNIRGMADKARAAGVAFRPHFKTHQSRDIGRQFREAGVDAITVSSVAMAETFAADGWRDILIAFPFNLRELDRVNRMDPEIRLHLLVDHEHTIEALKTGLTRSVGCYLKIDSGYGRSGVRWDRPERIARMVLALNGPLSFTGFLTHAGHAYQAADSVEILRIVEKTCRRMSSLRACMTARDIRVPVVSIGNTPGCTLARRFPDVDEIRPGNFVFFDLMQWRLGVCEAKRLAFALVCPICGIYPERGELVVMGGAVHFSKEKLDLPDGPCYGMGIGMTTGGFGELQPDIRLVALSQEHGVVRAPESLLETVSIGDRLAFVPVHSCLTADLYPAYRTPDGGTVPRVNSVDLRGAAFRE